MSNTVKWFGLGIVLLVLITLVSAQAPMTSSGYSASPTSSNVVQTNAAQYSQFYRMNSGPAPSVHISTPVQYDISGHTPTTVYLTTQNEAVPYSRYQAYANYTEGSSLWIQGTTDWAQYAVVPQGAIVSLIAISPTEGNGNLNFMDSDGLMYNYNFYFYNNSQMTFYADMPGRHVLSFVTGNKASNIVVIDVTGTYKPPSNYLPPPTYYYPGYNNSNINPQAALDLAVANREIQKSYNDNFGNWYYGTYSWLNTP